MLLSNVLSCIVTYFLDMCLSFVASYVFRGMKNAATRAAFVECS